ncbi:MAG TPA: hypothetical protein VK846_10880 [Candidatus Limnocylindria bacterium]|nr:hypothetical protein [Candidatus Limnocylindria bacterium]
MEFVKPRTFDEAIETIGKRSPIGSKLNSSEWAAVPVELRARAFFSSQVENVRFLQRGKDTITDFLSGAREKVIDPYGREQTALKAGSRAEFVKQMQSFAIAEGMGPLDPADAGTIKDITSQRRLELIFDTNTRAAQGFGYYKQGLDPDVLDAFPAQRFIRVADVSEPRGDHAQHEGIVLLKTDPFWAAINKDFGVPWQPFGWGCQHDVEDVDREEAEQLGLIKPGETVTAPEKSLNDRLQASTRHIDPDLRQTLRENLGDAAEFDDEEHTMRWKKKPKGATP